jgi:hypothetical protein
MANLDAPNGFTPSYHRNGGTVRYNGDFKIADGLASDIFLGDLVIIDSTADGVHIDLAIAASTRLLGVFAGCNYTAANGDVVFAKQWVSGTATLGGVSAEAHVYTDQNIVYTAQVEAAIAEADLFGYADLIHTHAGNAATGVSGMEIDGGTTTSPAATILQLKLLRAAPAPDGIFKSDITAAHSRVECMIAEGEYYVWDA